MKFKFASFCLITVLVLLLDAVGVRAQTNASLSRVVKWHPGHYVMVATRTPQSGYIREGFRGVLKIYNWKQLEPQEDQYNFANIRSDLAFLRQHDRYLVIQIQTKAFGKGANVSPAYLSSTGFPGGMYVTAEGSWNPTIWDNRVNQRLILLYQALGKEFDDHPCLEALIIPETAPGYNGKPPQPGVKPYSREKFVAASKSGMKVLKDAFPHTVVIQFSNFPLDALKELADYQKENGVGLGGPDVRPYDPALCGPKGVYRFYSDLAGAVPLGTAVQSPDYLVKYRHGPHDPTPVNEIYEFGRNKLHLNYMFWYDMPGYFNKVLAMMKASDFPKDPAGGLDAQLPRCFR